jgi:hypothetical protein
LDIKLETDVSTVVKNAVIDGVSDALTGGLPLHLRQFKKDFQKQDLMVGIWLRQEKLI